MQIANRDELEHRGALRLSRLNARHRSELSELLGNPPNPANVPASFWERVRQDIAAELLLLMLLVYSASAEAHGLPSNQAGLFARGYAEARSSEVAERFTGNARSRLEQYDADWKGRRGTPSSPIPPVEPNVPDRPSFPEQPPEPPAAPPQPEPIPRAEVEDALDVLFGPQNAERIAVDEVTGAQTAGGENGIQRTVGISQEDIWWTEADNRVCKTCLPYHKTPRSVWSLIYPNGPGQGNPHPGCRCWIVYANMLQPVEAK